MGLIPCYLGTYTPHLSNLSFTSVLAYLFLGIVSGLDAFSLYQPGRSHSACLVRQLINQRPRSSVPLVLTGPTPQVNNTSSRCRQTVSRRSKPNSRSLLMGEQPHPWVLLHTQDRESRQRSSKPRGRYVLLPATTQLSPG